MAKGFKAIAILMAGFIMVNGIPAPGRGKLPRNPLLQCVDEVCSPVETVEQSVKRAKNDVVLLSRVLAETRYARDGVIEPTIEQYSDENIQGTLISTEVLDKLEELVARFLDVARSNKEALEQWAASAIQLAVDCASTKRTLASIQRLFDIGTLTAGSEYMELVKECKATSKEGGSNGGNRNIQVITDEAKGLLESALESLTSIKRTIDGVLDQEACFAEAAYQDALVDTLRISETEAKRITGSGNASLEKDAKVKAKWCCGICFVCQSIWGPSGRRKRSANAPIKGTFGGNQNVDLTDDMIVKLAEYREGDNFCATPREILGLEYSSESASLLPFKHLLKDVFVDIDEEIRNLYQGLVDVSLNTPSVLPNMELFDKIVEQISESAIYTKGIEMIKSMSRECRAKFREEELDDDELKLCLLE